MVFDTNDMAQLSSRFWEDLINRPSGPMAFRFILQPVMAISFAIRDGIKDARLNRKPYFWLVLSDPSQRKAALKEGFRATFRILILSLVMDLIYQLIRFNTFYPMEAIVLTFLVAFVPYLLARGPAARIAKLWINRSHTP